MIAHSTDVITRARSAVSLSSPLSLSCTPSSDLHWKYPEIPDRKQKSLFSDTPDHSDSSNLDSANSHIYPQEVTGTSPHPPASSASALLGGSSSSSSSSVRCSCVYDSADSSRSSGEHHRDRVGPDLGHGHRRSAVPSSRRSSRTSPLAPRAVVRPSRFSLSRRSTRAQRRASEVCLCGHRA